MIRDEGCACDTSDAASGVCSDGTVDPEDGSCVQPATYEEDETTCDDLDNDCDGATDEGCACDFDGLPRGVCADTTRDDLGACVAPDTYERNESSCDGLDNDCDGSTDENCTCVFDGTDVGVCASGVLSMGQCSAPATYEADEATCDGLDNDCDGTTDEGCGDRKSVV